MYISKNILSSYMHKILHKILWLLPVLINYFSTRWQFYRFRKYVINMPPYNAIYWHNIWSSDQQKISIASRTKCLVFSHRFYTIRNWYILLIMFFYINPSYACHDDILLSHSLVKVPQTLTTSLTHSLQETNTTDLPDSEHPVNFNYEYDDADVNTLLLLRIQEAGLALDRTVLMPPLDNMGDQIVGQLLEERTRYRDQVLAHELEPVARTILLPVNLNNIHWVGLVIRLDAHNRVLQIQYIDPLDDCTSEDFIPEEIRRFLREVYGDKIRIERLTLLRQTDKTSCGVLTVENLIRAAQGLIDIQIADEEATLLIRRHHIDLLQLFRPDLQFNLKQKNNTGAWSTRKTLALSFMLQFYTIKLYSSPTTKLLSLFSKNSKLPNIVMLGKAGAGKSTLSRMLVDKYKYFHISIGDICRSISNGKADMYFTNDVKAKLLDKKIQHSILKNNSFILDGFPYDEEQCFYLCDIITKHKLKSNTIVIVLNFSDDDVLSRLISRRTCSKCAKNYNLVTFPPKIYDKCDVCESPLFIRLDDEDEEVKRRMSWYVEHSIPAIHLLEEQLDVCVINDIFRLFEQYLNLDVSNFGIKVIR